MPVINRPKKVRILSKDTDKCSKQYSFSDTEDQQLENNMDITYSARKLKRKVFTSTPRKQAYTEELNENIETAEEQQDDRFEQQDQASFFSERSSSDDIESSKYNEGLGKEIGNCIHNNKKSLLIKAMDQSAQILQTARYSRHSCFKDKTLDFIRNSRYRFWTKDYCRRVEWFSDKFVDADIINNKIYFVTGPGEYSCGACFRKLYGINTDFFYKWMKRFNKGAISSGFRKSRSTTSTTDDAALWLKEYALYRGDHLPVKEVIELPYKTRKIDIYNGYVDEQTENMKLSVSRANFYRIWKEKFKNLKIKQTNSFSRCATCTTLTTRLEKTRDCEERAELKRKIMAHNNRQMSERNYYKEKRKKAENSKREYLSLIIDGMDQSKTNLPHFTGRRSKAIDAANLLQTHVQGIINHGLGEFNTYVDINEYQHDSNLIMNTLLKEIYHSSAEMNSYLPEVLYIQADNCFRENKNRYMLAFCELLVRKNIFREVHLSFLYVGHTHEDIDAAFSRISEKLRKHDAETLCRLQELLPNSKQTGGLYDIKGWLEKHLNQIKGHSTPLHFKFSLDPKGQICVEYKGNNYRPWKKLTKPLLKSIPTGLPKILLPVNFKKFNFDGLDKNIEKCKYLFSDIADETQYRWWKRYIKYLKEVTENDEKMKLYAKRNARWILPLLPQRNGHAKKVSTLPKEIQELVDKELDDPEVEMPEAKKKGKKKANNQTQGTTKKTPKNTKKNTKPLGNKPVKKQHGNVKRVQRRTKKTLGSKQRTAKKATNDTGRKKRSRTVFHTYVYFSACAVEKKQRLHFEWLMLMELFVFLCGCYLDIYTFCLVDLHIFVNVLIKYHLEYIAKRHLLDITVQVIQGKSNSLTTFPYGSSIALHGLV